MCATLLSTYGEEQKAQVEKSCSTNSSLSKPRIEVPQQDHVLDARRARSLARANSRGINYTRKYWSRPDREGVDALLAAIDKPSSRSGD